MRCLVIGLALLLISVGLQAEDALRFTQPEIRLWPNGAPGSEGKSKTPPSWNPSTDGFHRITNIHDPSLVVFLPSKERANGAAFIVCPGGGHRYLVMDLEGSLVAEKLNAMGITVFVLKSRLARAEGSSYQVEKESLADVQRALRLVRSRAKEWNLDQQRIGIMGFSAGGELAALAETHFHDGDPHASDPIDRVSDRPDFAVLGYPGLRNSTITVPKTAPPTFIVVANDDPLAPGSIDFYSKLRAAGIPAEAHFYNQGGHGFGMTGRTPAFRNLSAAQWPETLHRWLADQKVITGPAH